MIRSEILEVDNLDSREYQNRKFCQGNSWKFPIFYKFSILYGPYDKERIRLKGEGKMGQGRSKSVTPGL